MATKKNLTDEEKNLLKKIKEEEKEYEEETRLFWENEYPLYSQEQKINYWLASVHHGMRIQGEATADEYSEFSSGWYDWVKSVEPKFDKIFKSLVPLLGFEFDWDEYWKRINS